jgi:predicted transcriptional regulator
MSDVEAAKVLGVSKTVIGDYRRAKSLPGTEVLAKACIHWSLKFDYKGFEISAKTFAPQNGGQVRSHCN